MAEGKKIICSFIPISGFLTTFFLFFCANRALLDQRHYVMPADCGGRNKCGRRITRHRNTIHIQAAAYLDIRFVHLL